MSRNTRSMTEAGDPVHCPWCRKIPEIQIDERDPYDRGKIQVWYRFMCSSGKCAVGPVSNWYESRQLAVEMWNDWCPEEAMHP